MKPNYDPAAMRATIDKPAAELRRLPIELHDKDAVTDVADYMLGTLYDCVKQLT